MRYFLSVFVNFWFSFTTSQTGSLPGENRCNPVPCRRNPNSPSAEVSLYAPAFLRGQFSFVLDNIGLPIHGAFPSATLPSFAISICNKKASIQKRFDRCINAGIFVHPSNIHIVWKGGCHVGKIGGTLSKLSKKEEKHPSSRSIAVGNPGACEPDGSRAQPIWFDQRSQPDRGFYPWNERLK